MSTPASLLMRLREPTDHEAWRRFVRLYTPLLYYWARRAGVLSQDADDLVQDVLVSLVHVLPTFVYDPSRSFRHWLKAVLLNKWRAYLRRPAARPAPVDDVPDSDPPDAFWEGEYRRHLVGRALRLMQAEFHPTTWRACWACVVDGRPAADVAAELGVSVPVVYSAKCRVLRRLLEELQGLIE